MTDYTDILDRSWDDIPEPQLLPVGTWRLRSRNAVYKEAPSGDKDDYIMFVYSPTEPLDDVDVESLAELGEYDYASNRLFVRFYVADMQDWNNVRKHMAKHTGADVSGEKTPRQSIKDFKGGEVNAYLGVRNYTDNAGEAREENVASQFRSVDD